MLAPPAIASNPVDVSKPLRRSLEHNVPRSGGEADKLGNLYEAVWTVHTVLDVFEGILKTITVEPLDEQAHGIEFYVECNDGSPQYHSVKRQKQGGDWSVAKLCRPEPATGRSVLGDLFQRSLSDHNVKTRFVSSTGANQLRELEESASPRSNVSEYRRSLSAHLQPQFDNTIVPVCDGDDNRAFMFLKNLKVILHSHQHLIEVVERRIAGLFYHFDRSNLDVGDLRRAIAEYVLGSLGTRIDGEQVREYLQGRRIGSRDWKIDPTIILKISRINNSYITTIEPELINSAHIARDIVDDIINGLEDSNSKGALIVAPGGFGKSCVIAQCISRLSALRTPFITLRMDTCTPCNTSRQLGEQLDLPASPAVVLAGIADNATSVLVVDQLDAMSLISGRHPAMWTAFNALCNDVQSYPNMKMILACRDFDLEHDYRLRPLTDQYSGFAKHELAKLNRSELIDSLVAAGIRDFVPSDRQLAILSVPFHLMLFVHGKASPSFTATRQLYDSYWNRKLQNLKARLGREPHWNEVIDSLTERMSADQVLFAPKVIVDDWSNDAVAMASEHVLVDVADQHMYRFFHESFFDYAYARRFAATGRSLLDFLTATEQHLFRRSQVRQILDFLREHDFRRYIRSLGDVLGSDVVRFHIRRMVSSAFARIDVPRPEEWELVEPLLFAGPLSRYISEAIYGHLGWFDLLVSNGVFRRWLASRDGSTIDRAIRYLEPPDLQELRSSEIAALISPYAQADTAWQRRIMRIMSWRKIHKSEPMRSLHIAMLESGAYDDYSGTHAGGGFWNQYYDTENECPTFSIDVLRTWFGRAVERFDDGGYWSFLHNYAQNKSDIGAQLVLAAARAAPLYYVEQMLSVVVAAIVKTESTDGDDVRNRLWPMLSNVANPNSIDESILLSLRQALQHLAKHDVGSFRRHVTTLLSYRHQTIAYLILSSWHENPDAFADECVQYLLDDHQRLDIGYGCWVSNDPGTGHCAISRRAITAVSSLCSRGLFADLETAIVGYLSAHEIRSSEHRGFTELLLLRALDESRMSSTAESRIRILERKFPDVEDAIVEEDAALEMKAIGSPIPKKTARSMTDDQWIAAMHEYKNSSHRTLDGGALELSRLMTEFAGIDRSRFASLAVRMPDDIDSIYFSAILNGMSGWSVNPGPERDADKTRIEMTETDVFLGVLDRVHALPGKPCASSIVYCIQTLSERSLPQRILAMVSYYAIYDQDPQEDLWRKDSLRDPYQHGINSVRGRAAEAIASLLLEDEARLDSLRGALDALTRDGIVAVRTCAVNALLPLLNFSRDLAVKLFVVACRDCHDLWRTHQFERFIHYAVHTHYVQLRPLLQSALRSQDDGAVECVAGQIVLAELHDVDVGSDGDYIRAGTDIMRKGAVGVYARNIGREIVGPESMARLEEFLDDGAEEVTREASQAFFHVSDEWLGQSGAFTSRFIESRAFESRPYDLLRVLEESSGAVPEVVCAAAERLLGFLGEEGTHVAYHGSMAAKSISTLVVRQYQQTTDEVVKTKCLDLIDRMECAGYFGIDGELAKLER